jgi:hypothetical protein
MGNTDLFFDKISQVQSDLVKPPELVKNHFVIRIGDTPDPGDKLIRLFGRPCDGKLSNVSFTIINIASVSVAGVPSYTRNGAEDPLDTVLDPKYAEVEVYGDVKFDGCMNFTTNLECMIHVCDTSGLLAITNALLEARKLAKEAMGSEIFNDK